MNRSFWMGFEKRGAEQASVVSDWIDDDLAAEDEAKKDKLDTRCDPRELSEWQGPEAWYRWGWP